jgi:GT2 family glycosyltransferase
VTPVLAVQVVNYRTRSYLERCLETVTADLEASGLAYQINLLENASGENLEDLAERFHDCTLYAAPRNLGFGAGHNLLAAKTTASHLLILNPDVEFASPATARRLLEAVTSSDGVIAAGPKLVAFDGSAQPWDHGRLHGLRAQISLRGGHSYWREADTRLEVAWVSGAVLLVDRVAFAAVGGFDENLFLYKEDEDLCLRLRGAGAKVVYEPAVVVRHHGSAVAERSDELARASRYFMAKHHPNRLSRKAFAAIHHGLPYVDRRFPRSRRSVNPAR